MSPSVWLPEEPIFLEKADEPHVRPHRPLNQGDIFVDVPQAVVARKEGLPAVNLSDTFALLLGHTCSIRAGANLVQLQTVCEVRPASDREKATFAEPWDGWWTLFPLVGFKDDALWVADFNLVSTVHVKHLREKRVACLNERGWAALQKRFANHCVRDSQPLEIRQADSHYLWVEIELCEEWCSRGHREPDFFDWLKEPIAVDCPYKGTPRSKALDLAGDFIRSELPEAAAAA